MTKERPILFSGEMVRAILDGRKTQTRRIVNKKILKINPGTGLQVCNHTWPGKRVGNSCSECYQELLKKCPYGQIGDVLWLREAWKTMSDFDDLKPSDLVPELHKSAIDYVASGNNRWNGKTRPSIYMPRWASRISLKIRDIRVEQLQDISEEDAIAEGLRCKFDKETTVYPKPGKLGMHPLLSAKDSFKSLWQSINGNWDDNPWVWVVEFERLKERARDDSI